MRIHDAHVPQIESTHPRSGIYTLAWGENLESTARKFNILPTALLDANPQILQPSLVGPGDTLHIPSVTETEFGDSSIHPDLAFGAMAQSTSDLPPVVVTPDPYPDPDPDPFPGPPDLPPDPWDPGPSDPGDPGGGGDLPVTSARSVQELADVFGQDFADILDKTPTLKAALEALFAQNWEVRLGTVSEVQFPSAINIAPSMTPEATIATLAHEIGHATHGNQFDWSGLEAFVNSGLITEAEGALVNLQIRDELSAQGIDIPILSSNLDTTAALYDQVWAGFQQDGDRGQAIDALANIFRQHESNASGVGYVQYYTDYYNANQTPPPSPPGGGGGGEDPSPPQNPN